MGNRDGRIIAVGTDAQINRLAAHGSHRIALGGRTVIPGLIDGHAHMDNEGLKSIFPSLSGCASIADIQERVAELARRAKPGDWIVTMPIGTPPYYRDAHGGLGRAEALSLQSQFRAQRETSQGADGARLRHAVHLQRHHGRRAGQLDHRRRHRWRAQGQGGRVRQVMAHWPWLLLLGAMR
ncbi:MAG: hypothetical protein EXR28_09925 [Betaproteobacteria bacterium]|nr:hypothetical protein [Betaproteobacteria bacterium]